jgi:hypothetical protein
MGTCTSTKSDENNKNNKISKNNTFGAITPSPGIQEKYIKNN